MPEELQQFAVDTCIEALDKESGQSTGPLTPGCCCCFEPRLTVLYFLR